MQNCHLFNTKLVFTYFNIVSINAIQDGADHGWRGARKAPLPKICLSKEDPKKKINRVTHTMIFADISIFPPEINFFYIKKYR